MNKSRRKKRLSTIKVGVKTSDAALKLIIESGVNINDIKGTGKDGSIIKKDVEKYLKTIYTTKSN